MKKSLVALAALAAVGAASAQVTLYGRLDIGYSNSVTTTTNAAGTASTDSNQIGVTSHNSVSSLWGITGSEDLGSNLKANFKFEADLFPATGRTGASGGDNGYTSASNGSFDRVSLVGLSGDFGTLNLGKDYTPTFKTIAASDLFGLSRLSVVGLPAGVSTKAVGSPAALIATGGTVDRQVTYTTPSFSGLTATVSFGNTDQTSGATTNVARDQHVAAAYNNGPIYVGVAWGSNESAAATTSKAEQTALSGSYDLGVAKIVGGWTSVKATNSAQTGAFTQTEFNIGASVPMGAVTLLGQFGRNSTVSDYAGAAATAADLTGTDWVLGADYSLSKRTALFVKTGVVNKQEGTAAGVAYATKLTETNFGVKTTF